MAQGALADRIARLLGGLVARQGFLILLPGEMALRQIVVGHGAAVSLLQDFDRPIVPSQQVQTHAKPDVAGGRRLLAALELSDGVAENGVLGEVAGDRLLHLPHFARAECVVLQHGLFQIELDGLSHRGLLLITLQKATLVADGMRKNGRRLASPPTNRLVRKSQRRESNP